MKPDQLFSLESLLTMGGASLGVTLVGNTAQYILGWNPRWLGLVVALAIAGLGATTRSPVTWVDAVVAFFQGLQIFAAAVGITSIAASVDKTRSFGSRPGRRSFWALWF